MGDESKKLPPACSALSTTARTFCSTAVPCTSNVCQVPIPITGTFKPLFPRTRCSISFSFTVLTRFLVHYKSYHAERRLIALEIGRAGLFKKVLLSSHPHMLPSVYIHLQPVNAHALNSVFFRTDGPS